MEASMNSRLEHEACGFTCRKGHYCNNDAAHCPWHADDMIEFCGAERCVACEPQVSREPRDFDIIDPDDPDGAEDMEENGR